MLRTLLPGIADVSPTTWRQQCHAMLMSFVQVTPESCPGLYALATLQQDAQSLYPGLNCSASIRMAKVPELTLLSSGWWFHFSTKIHPKNGWRAQKSILKMVDGLEGHTHVYIYDYIDILIYIYVHLWELSFNHQSGIHLSVVIWPSGTQLVASPGTRFQGWLQWQHGQVRRSSSPQATFPPFPRCAWKWIPRQANGIVAIMTWRHPCIRCRPSYRVQLGQIVEENRTVWFSIWKKGPPRQCFPPI